MMVNLFLNMWVSLPVQIGMVFAFVPAVGSTTSFEIEDVCHERCLITLSELDLGLAHTFTYGSTERDCPNL